MYKVTSRKNRLNSPFGFPFNKAQMMIQNGHNILHANKDEFVKNSTTIDTIRECLVFIVFFIQGGGGTERDQEFFRGANGLFLRIQLLVWGVDLILN